jgi:hypothetical protein
MSKLSNVIVMAGLTGILTVMTLVPTAGAQQSLQEQVDSLFVIASSGEVMYRIWSNGLGIDSGDGTDRRAVLIELLTTSPPGSATRSKICSRRSVPGGAVSHPSAQTG